MATFSTAPPSPTGGGAVINGNGDGTTGTTTPPGDILPPSSNGDQPIGDVYASSEAIPCDSRTRDLGIFDGYHGGILTKVRLCELDMPSSGSEDGGKARVNSRVSGAFASLVDAAKAAGLNPSANSSFRSQAHQQALWDANPNPAKVARPGNSNHQMGLAIDFSMTGTGSTSNCKTISGICTPSVHSDLYDWLRANSCTYGIRQYNGEFWHFDTLDDSTRSCGAI
ncbi:MAG: D-alanyl-D-alanine carboxypeptidase family protein [Candidatus Nomurabacteria bacterium]|jgi:hypothetical protein|nr:D-alanyl-D-alanine carboxypeptidase family protein [Candidatus Nomurabacteria bacterium]